MKKLLCLLMLVTLLPLPALADDLPMRGRGVFNLLLLGADAADSEAAGRSDTIIVLQLNRQTGTLRMASFLRDLYVDIPGHGKSRLNAAYAWGGAELAEATLRETFGVTVDAYAAVDFARLVRIVDALGGVQVTVTEAEQRAANGLIRSYNHQLGLPEDDGLIARTGSVLLTGRQALGFARIRKLDSDFGRTARQRRVLEAAFRKAMSLDAISLAHLALTNLDAVDTNLDFGDILALIPTVLACRNAEIETLAIPDAGMYRDATIDGMMVLVPEADACKKALRDFFGV